MERCLGEAYFLRAHYYFILVRCFGGVPIRTVPAEVDDPKDIARNSITEVYDLIIKDCKEAISRLPQKNELTPADLGRATKDAAYTQLAKVYLTLASYGDTYQLLAPEEGFFQAVVNLCDQIKDMGYDLSHYAYADLWNEKILSTTRTVPNQSSRFNIQAKTQEQEDSGLTTDKRHGVLPTWDPEIPDSHTDHTDGTSPPMNFSMPTNQATSARTLPFFMKAAPTLTEKNIKPAMLS